MTKSPVQISTNIASTPSTKPNLNKNKFINKKMAETTKNLDLDKKFSFENKKRSSSKGKDLKNKSLSNYKPNNTSLSINIDNTVNLTSTILNSTRNIKKEKSIFIVKKNINLNIADKVKEIRSLKNKIQFVKFDKPKKSILYWLVQRKLMI